MPMNLLAIDTSTESATVAISQGSSIYSLELVGARQHAQNLLPMIQKLMAQHALSWSALQGIVFDQGPGSFTGLRIGCSIAKALAYAHHLPLFGISSMQVIFEQAKALTRPPDTGILACGDARMQEIYWAYYAPDDPEIAPIRVDAVGAIQLSSKHPILLAGWGLDSYHLDWPSTLRQKFIGQYSMFPKAETLIRLVQSGEYNAMTAADALPLYVRNQVTHSGETHG